MLIEASRNTSEEIQRINETQTKLKNQAEITINYRHLPYGQLKDIDLPNLEVSRFTPGMNVIRSVTNTYSRYFAKKYQR